MVYSLYVRQRILCLRRLGKDCKDIVSTFESEGHRVSKSGVNKFIKRHRETGTLTRQPGTGAASKFTEEAQRLVEEQMEKDDETTLAELQAMLAKKGIKVSTSTLHRWRKDLGWTSKGTRYCQMIRSANVVKRLDWALANSYEQDKFDDIVFSDETSVQLENHRRTCSYKVGRKPRYKPKPKHPIKLHVWAGISARGRTSCCIFEGKMDARLFTSIVESSLLPFTSEVYPDGYRFVQDNDPKHASKFAQEFYREKGINWWRTPPESPDLNPIENLWHELKEFIRREAKPRTKDDLQEGILAFWRTVDAAKCRKYIGHLAKVIPEVIRCEGQATGF